MINNTIYYDFKTFIMLILDLVTYLFKITQFNCLKCISCCDDTIIIYNKTGYLFTLYYDVYIMTFLARCQVLTLESSSSLPPVTENSTREKVFFCY